MSGNNPHAKRLIQVRRRKDEDGLDGEMRRKNRNIRVRRWKETQDNIGKACVGRMVAVETRNWIVRVPMVP